MDSPDGYLPSPGDLVVVRGPMDQRYHRALVLGGSRGNHPRAVRLLIAGIKGTRYWMTGLGDMGPQEGDEWTIT